MKVLEWVKKLLKALGLDLKIADQITSIINIKFRTGSKNNVTIHDNRTIIQAGEDSQELRDCLKEIFSTQVESDKPLLDTEAERDVEEASHAVVLDEKDNELLTYYKDKLPQNLFEILRLSLIHRRMRRKHRDAKGFKRRIMSEYPIYGRNMTNLVNEGYFEYKFKELYQEMAKEEDFEIGQYQKEIEYQVRNLPSMIFIDPKRSYEDLLAEGRWKLYQMVEHGLEEITFHAIGYENIQSAERLIRDLSAEDERFRELIENAPIWIRKNTYFKMVLNK